MTKTTTTLKGGEFIFCLGVFAFLLAADIRDHINNNRPYQQQERRNASSRPHQNNRKIKFTQTTFRLNQEDDDNKCRICWDSKAVVFSTACCGKPMACVKCAEKYYNNNGGGGDGSSRGNKKKCLNCNKDVGPNLGIILDNRQD